MPQSAWRRINYPMYGWVNTLQRIICAADPPEVCGPTVIIASDYSGEHRESEFDVASILYLDMEASAEWQCRRLAVRERYLPDGRRLSFKQLGDRQRRKALVPFLEAADEILGISVTVAIRKSIQNLCSDEHTFLQLRNRLPFACAWERRPFEYMLRISHLISVLIAGFAHPKQNIYWISDQDKLFANANKSEDLRRMLSQFTSHYVKHPLGEIGLGTTDLDEGDRLEEDLASIPDLAAGAVSEMLNKLSVHAGGRLPLNVALPYSDSFSPKTELLCSWLSDNSQRLKRIIIVFERNSEQGFTVFRFGNI